MGQGFPTAVPCGVCIGSELYDLLKGLRVVEVSSFIAAPSCGLYLQQFGAEVIRIDGIGGGPDYRRWPLAPGGASFYWEGLNKGKKSVALDLRNEEGRSLAIQIATAAGPSGGLLVTNYPQDSFLSHPALRAERDDMITLRVMGWPDGQPAVDYTVNSAVGIPDMTGSADSDRPTNHVLPAWDLLAGAYAAFVLLGAERRRCDTGKGAEIRLSLSDVAMATLGHLGQIAEVEVSGEDRPRIGNDLFGAFGRDFVTRDGKRVMIVAITARQWSALVAALDLTDAIAALEHELGVSFATDEGERFKHRERLFVSVAAATAMQDVETLTRTFNQGGVCWGPYQSLKTALSEDQRFSIENAVFDLVSHRSGHSYRTAGAAATLEGELRRPPQLAPQLGEHTHEVLASLLGLKEREIADLMQAGLAAGPFTEC